DFPDHFIACFHGQLKSFIAKGQLQLLFLLFGNVLYGALYAVWHIIFIGEQPDFLPYPFNIIGGGKDPTIKTLYDSRDKLLVRIVVNEMPIVWMEGLSDILQGRNKCFGSMAINSIGLVTPFGIFGIQIADPIPKFCYF